MRTALVGLGLVLGGCPADGEAPPSPAERLALYEADGAYRAGYRELLLDYKPPFGADRRESRLAVWYPTEVTQGGEVRYRGLFDAPGVLDDPLPAEGPFPLILFSHGHQGDAENMGRTCAHLATHGYVVAAPTHTGNTTYDFGERTTAIYALRPWDVSATLDALLGPASALDAVVAEGVDDLSLEPEALVMGHSFGGFTAMALAGAVLDLDTFDAACAGPEGADDPLCSDWETWRTSLAAGFADPRLQAAALLAGGDFRRFGVAGVADVDLPILQLTGALDGSVRNETNGDPYFAALTGPAIRGDLAHGDHHTWTDFAGNDVLPGADPDALEPARGWRITRIALTAFAEAMLRKDVAALEVLDGDPAIDEDVTWTAKAVP